MLRQPRHHRRTVVSFWSPSSVASRLVQEKLGPLLGWEPSSTTTNTTTTAAAATAATCTTKIPSKLLPQDWDRVTLTCPQSGTTLQWLSLDHSNNNEGSAPLVDARRPFRLLAVQELAANADDDDDNHNSSDSDSDNNNNNVEDHGLSQLEESLAVTMQSTKISVKRLLRQPITAQDLLGRAGLPLLLFPSDADSADKYDDKDVDSANSDPFQQGRLKEIAIPTFDNATYANGQTLQQTLSQASCSQLLSRPVTGLYQLGQGYGGGSGLCLRPLPTGAEDRHLAPPSLVFHADKLQELPWFQQEADGKVTCTSHPPDEVVVGKIGYNGIRGRGQLMVQSAAWWGMDVRFCESPTFRPAFAEAQEALLAGSLPSLQSQHVLDGAQGTIDPKTNQADCWIEFRASLSNPVALWSRSKAKKPRIAKVPDIPYE